MSCPELSRLDAWFDGELAETAAADVERHSRDCAECRARLAELTAWRGRLRRDALLEPAPSALRKSIARRLEAAAFASRQVWRSRPFGLGALAGAALVAGLVAVVFAPGLLRPMSAGALIDQVVAAHVDSLLPQHLTAVVSTDRHTVKPWFAGRADVSPPVADFADRGYPLIGGRVARLDRQRAAVVVYGHGTHIINVFTWQAQGELPQFTNRRGYRVQCWRSADLESCAVSDAGWDELGGLVSLLRELGAGDTRG